MVTLFVLLSSAAEEPCGQFGRCLSTCYRACKSLEEPQAVCPLSQPGMILPPSQIGHLARTGVILVVTLGEGGGLLESSGQRSGMLLTSYRALDDPHYKEPSGSNCQQCPRGGPPARSIGFRPRCTSGSPRSLVKIQMADLVALEQGSHNLHF